MAEMRAHSPTAGFGLKQRSCCLLGTTGSGRERVIGNELGHIGGRSIAVCQAAADQLARQAFQLRHFLNLVTPFENEKMKYAVALDE